MIGVTWLLAAQSVLDLIVLFVGGATACWAGVGLGIWTALRCHHSVVSSAVIVLVWAVALMVPDNLVCWGCRLIGGARRACAARGSCFGGSVRARLTTKPCC